MILLSALALASCSGPKAPDAEAPGLVLGDLAGTWSMEGMPIDHDTVVATATVIGEGDPLVFTENFPGADPVPLDVTVAGDSVIMTNGPFPSDMRPGVMVSTDAVYRMVGSRLVGLLNAHYDGDTTADSLLRFRVTMTRVR